MVCVMAESGRMINEWTARPGLGALSVHMWTGFQLHSRPVNHPPPLQVPNCVVHLAEITIQHVRILEPELTLRKNSMTKLGVGAGVIVVAISPPLNIHHNSEF
jgi:hypothetical protein